jgi:hypothetical protein
MTVVRHGIGFIEPAICTGADLQIIFVLEPCLCPGGWGVCSGRAAPFSHPLHTFRYGTHCGICMSQGDPLSSARQGWDQRLSSLQKELRGLDPRGILKCRRKGRVHPNELAIPLRMLKAPCAQHFHVTVYHLLCVCFAQLWEVCQ